MMNREVKPSRFEIHSDQARRVADSLMHDNCHEVYRRRLLAGTAAVHVRDAVRIAVIESLKNPVRTHAQAGDAGALAADHALAQVGIEVERVGFQRAGLRARLVAIDELLSKATPDGSDRYMKDAISELRSLIEGIHES